MINLTVRRKLPVKLRGMGRRAGITVAVALFGATLGVPLLGGGRALAAWPTTPPAQICDNSTILDGPSTAPSGAVTVPAGDNSGFNFNQPGATFWFASGTHTLGTDMFGQIIARANTTYIGAPGAILDGQNLNLYAFTNNVANVTIKYLTIQNFGRGNDNNNEGVVNHDAGTNWTVQYNTVTKNDGAGVFLGTDNTVSYNCLKDNGQYGFSMFKMPIEGDSAIKNIVIDHNEISGNNTDDWESQIEGCGCTGAGKFWDVNGATVTNNWVHDNLGTALWADTNNIDFLIEGNYIENNDGEGIWYEISYNATIRNNTIKQNAWVSGRANTGSPGAAIYLSESGGDSRLDYTVSGAPQIRIYDNNFDNNFSGVSIYENANRFCNSNGNTSKGYCTPFINPTLIPEEPRSYEYADPISTEHPCYTEVATAPYTTDCRWHSKNIEVYQNEFHFDDAVVPCAGTFCGAQALYATGDNNLSWSPYTVSGVQNDVMFNNRNSFHDNDYFGDWVFAKGYGETISFNDWRAAPYNQDAGSTFDGDPGHAGPGEGAGGGESSNGSGGGSSVQQNDLDADTAGLESSAGEWADWYSATVSQSTGEAHSGTHSLKVNITDPWGWGAQLANWPGFATSAGVKKISFWGKLGTGTNLQPKMTVKWLDESYNVLQTDAVTLPVLTSSWQNVSSIVEAPAGSATALLRLSGANGAEGDSFYLDDMVVGEAPNVLDADTAGLETSEGRWSGWYSATASRSTAESFKGGSSLEVAVTDPWGWALQTNNWPGFATTAGDKRISFAAKKGTGTMADVTLRLKWYDASQALLQTDTLEMGSLSSSWQTRTGTFTAPSGTATVSVEVYGKTGSATDIMYLDDISIINLN